MLLQSISRVMAGGAVVMCLAACTTVPSTNIAQPLSARPVARPPQAENSGAIFQPKQGVALFEDRRPRFVGDILTVRLVENTEAKRKSEIKDERKASADVSVPSPMLLGKTLPGIGATTWAPSGSNTQDFKDNETNTHSFTGAITVTVVDVLENGNLVVSGEKQVSINNDTEYVRLAGVVNPMNISRDGTVNSTQLADAHIESRNSQSLDQSQVVSLMARFFLTLVPF